MADFQFVRGEYATAPYTPSGGPIAAGGGVLLGAVASNTAGQGALLGIAHNDIAQSVQGTIAIGGGVYDGKVASNYAAGTLVYKPSGNAILTTTSTGNAQFGYTLEDAAAANSVVNVIHVPYARAVD